MRNKMNANPITMVHTWQVDGGMFVGFVRLRDSHRLPYRLVANSASAKRLYDAIENALYANKASCSPSLCGGYFLFPRG